MSFTSLGTYVASWETYRFYRETKLPYLLYRSTEDICAGIDVFKRFQRVAHVEKSVSIQQHFEQFARKQEELNWSLLKIL